MSPILGYVFIFLFLSIIISSLLRRNSYGTGLFAFQLKIKKAILVKIKAARKNFGTRKQVYKRQPHFLISLNVTHTLLVEVAFLDINDCLTRVRSKRTDTTL